VSGTIANLAIKVFVDNKAAVVGLGKTADQMKGLGGISAKIGLGLGRVSGVLGQIGMVAGPAAAVIGTVTAAATAAAYSFYSLLKPSFDLIDSQRDMALKLGVSQEAIQKLALAAEFSGASLEDLVKAMLLMTKKGGVGSIEKNFFALIKELSQIEDQSKRVQEAFKHFGKGASAILPLLAEPENLLEAVDAIERFDLAISDIDAKKIDDAKDKLHLLGTVIRGNLNKVAIEVAPVITAMVDKLLDKFEAWGAELKKLGVTWATIGDVFVATGAVIATVLDVIDAEVRRLVAGLALVKNALEIVNNPLNVMKDAKEGLKALKDYGKASEDMLKALAGKSATDFIDAATKLRTSTHTKGRGADVVGGLGTTSSKAVEKGTHEAQILELDTNPITKAVDKTTKAVDRVGRDIKRHRADANIRIATFV